MRCAEDVCSTVFGCSAWKADDDDEDASTAVPSASKASDQRDSDAEVQSLRWLREVVPLLLSSVGDDANTTLILSAIAVPGFLPDAIQQPQFKTIRDSIWSLLADKSKHQVPAVRAAAVKSIGSSFSAVGIVSSVVLQCILTAAEDGNVMSFRIACHLQQFITLHRQVIVRQRAAWSLSNIISALCEYVARDGEEADAPAVALQGLAQATCATVRKCLNDNDKVCGVLICDHRCHVNIVFLTLLLLDTGSFVWYPLRWYARSARSQK